MIVQHFISKRDLLSQQQVQQQLQPAIGGIHIEIIGMNTF
jgi:hypothetical protein